MSANIKCCVCVCVGIAAGGLKVTDIDAYWLQRSLSKFYDDANQSQRYAEVCDVLLLPLSPAPATVQRARSLALRWLCAHCVWCCVFLLTGRAGCVTSRG